MPRDYETEYYGLLHAMKEASAVLKSVRDSVMDQVGIDRVILLFDHEIAKGSNGPGR